MAKLYYKYGTMGSAKSSLLLMTAHSFDERGIQFLCLKPTIDTRDGTDVIVSRIGIKRECVGIEPTDNLYDLINEYSEIATNGYLYGRPQWILVDECQFLSEEQVDQLSEVVDFMGINVICYGLRTDFRTRLFEGSKRLMEVADDIEEMKISCECGRKAIHNARIDSQGAIVTSGEQVLIGGDDTYKPMCRKCYNEAKKKVEQLN